MSLKSELVSRIRAELRAHLDRLTGAAKDAHAAATDPGSKAESKYDTRNLEASYLAKGQARQVDEVAEAVRIFETLILPEFGIEDRIDAGALVEVDLNGETTFFLLAPVGGGMTLEHEGGELTVLTPESPMHQRLIGLRTGDSLESPALLITEVS
jgi:hypothetical protein